jgi:hypothetical protein
MQNIRINGPARYAPAVATHGSARVRFGVAACHATLHIVFALIWPLLQRLLIG